MTTYLKRLKNFDPLIQLTFHDSSVVLALRLLKIQLGSQLILEKNLQEILSKTQMRIHNGRCSR